MEPAASVAPVEAEAQDSGAAFVEAAGLAPAERVRRAAALHQACARLLRVPPEHRPRSLAALCRLVRGSCVARTASVNPLSVAVALGVPEDVLRLLASRSPSAVGGLEVLPEEALATVRHQWAALKARGWVARSAAAEVARWVKSRAVVQSSYAPLDVVRALCVLGLVAGDVAAGGAAPVDCSQMTEAACARALPRPTLLDACVGSSSSCVVTRAVSIPPRCKSAFIGRRGSNKARVALAIMAKLSEAGGVLRVSLSAQDHVVVVTMEFAQHPAIPVDASERADIATALLKAELEAIYRERVEASRRRRAALQQCRQQQGRDYHQDLRLQRHLQRELPAAARALALPETGVDGFGFALVCRPYGKPCGERYVRKEAGQWRRRAWLRQKRRELLRLCAAGEARGLAAGAAAWREPELGTARMRACQRLLASAHLSRPCGGDGPREASRMCNRGAARRLRSHLASVAAAAGWLAPTPRELAAVHGDRHSRRPTPLAPRSRAARKAKGRRGLAVEIADGLRAVH